MEKIIGVKRGFFFFYVYYGKYNLFRINSFVKVTTIDMVYTNIFNASDLLQEFVV